MSEYAKSGVSHEAKDAGLAALVGHLRGTFGNHPAARVRDDIGHFASLVEIPGTGLLLAVSTDSVATKVLVAQMANRHDSVGIDCVAINANDIACVGADPLTLVDYIGVNVPDPAVMEALGRGFAEGARRAEISIAGGELAQVRDLVKGHGEGCHYDLVGTCVGVVAKDRVIDGANVVPGDVVVGIASTGLHANGYSLARRVIFDTMRLDVNAMLPETGGSVADALLAPTAIYVRECKALNAKDVAVKALIHVTGGSFANVLRIRARGVGFVFDTLPDPPPLFNVLRKGGSIPVDEMHSVFNMGVGFLVVVAKKDADAVISVAKDEGKQAWVVGRAIADPEQRAAIVRRTFTGCFIASKAKAPFIPSPTLPREFYS